VDLQKKRNKGKTKSENFLHKKPQGEDQGGTSWEERSEKVTKGTS